MTARIRIFRWAAFFAVGCAAVVGIFLWMRAQPSDSAERYVRRPQGSINFSMHIAPIVYEHCVNCHRPGESAPFSLLDYTDCRQRATQIADVVTRRIMPPWLPDATLVHFEDERVLTADEKGMLQQWAEEGARQGEPSDLPPRPQWVEGWQLGEPDLIVEMPEEFALPAEGGDVFRNFVIPTPVNSTKFVRAVEIRPGNTKIVHHGVLLIDSTQESRRLDEQDDEPGFGGMVYGLTAHSPDGHFLGWTPGKMPFVAPDGMPWRLEPHTDLVLQFHMLTSGKSEVIRAKIGLFFTDTPPLRQPLMLRLGSQTIDIPAGESQYRIEDEIELPVDVDVLGVYPHAHYLAREMNGEAVDPDGNRRCLLRISEWDFNWQDEYRFRQPISLTKGTRLRMEYTYDNSTNNVRNPHHPPQRVVWGPQSSDEMGDLWIQVLPRDARDRDVLKAAFARKEFEAYRQGYSHAVTVDPNDASARYNLACLLEQAGNLDDAEMHYRHALRIEPDHAQSLNNLGVVYCKRGRIEQAVPLFEKALELQPEYRDARDNLAQAQQFLKGTGTGGQRP